MLEVFHYLPEVVSTIAFTAAILKVSKPAKVEKLQTFEKGGENFPAILRIDSLGNSHVFIPTGAKVGLEVDGHRILADDFRYDPGHGHYGGINITVDEPVWPFEMRTVNVPFEIPGLIGVEVTYFGSILNHQIWQAIKPGLLKPEKVRV